MHVSIMIVKISKGNNKNYFNVFYSDGVLSLSILSINYFNLFFFIKSIYDIFN